MDRLSYESPERVVCVKSLLSESEYQRLRYFVPSSQNEYQEITNLGNKVMSCWGFSSDSQKTDEAGGQYYSPLETEKCLIKKLGENAYKSIYQGQKVPSYEEHLIFEVCNGNTKPDTINYFHSNQDIPKTTTDCLKEVLSNDVYNQVRAGKNDVPAEFRKKVDACFGIDPQPFEEGRVYKIPDETKVCLITTVGDKRFAEINTGQGKPTEEERTKGNACFAKLNSTQTKFLPPPPEQILFVEEDPETINFNEISQATQIDKGKKLGGKLVLRGNAPPDSNVLIYVFSEPIVITTKADENGDWIYELNQPLSGTKHTAYAAVRTTSGKIVKSSVFDFTVIAADEDIENRFLSEEETSQPTQGKFIKIALALVTLAVLLLTIFYFLYFQKKLKKETTKIDNSNTEGNNEEDTGSGSVN